MDVRLPKLGEGAEAGTVIGIAVKEGDQVTKGQTLVELENEKAVAPIPSPTAGRIGKLHVKEGDKISVGHLIATIEAEGAQPGAPAKATPAKPAESSAAEKPAAPPPAEDEREIEGEPTESNLPPAASPTIRKLARELGIDLRRVRGSEAGGRIVMADLRDYIARLEKLAASKPKASAGAPQPAAVAESIDFSQWGPVEKKPLTSLRQTISRRMLQSWTTIPHVTQFDDADVTRLNDLRKEHAPAYEKKGAKLTLTPLILKAVVAALKKHPLFNASIDETTNEVVLKNYFHLGLAVDTEQGLIVPVIRDVDKKSILQLANDVSSLAERARDRKVSLDELKGGSFTISNQGGIGGAHFTPIINKPETAILGLGRSGPKAVVRDGKIEARIMLPLALSYDHRLVDGGSAARFIVDLVKELENFPETELKAGAAK